MPLYHSGPKTPNPKTIMAQENRNTQFPAGATAAPQPQSPTPSPQSSQQSPRPCPQDCNRCGIQQQIFCSTKMLFDLSRAYQESRQQIASMEAAIAGIQAQLQSAGTDGQLSTPFIEKT